MMGSTVRVRRLLSQELESCCTEDGERRLDELNSLADATLGDPAWRIFAGLVTRRTEGNWRYYDATGLAEERFGTDSRGDADGE
jgi:hypothetical protein